MNKSLLNDHLDYLISKVEQGKKCVIVYKGFPLDFINSVATELIPYATEPGCRVEGQKIDLKKISENSRFLAKKVLDSDLPDNSVMLYEEFYLLSRSLDLSLFRVTRPLF